MKKKKTSTAKICICDDDLTAFEADTALTSSCKYFEYSKVRSEEEHCNIFSPLKTLVSRLFDDNDTPRDNKIPKQQINSIRMKMITHRRTAGSHKCRGEVDPRVRRSVTGVMRNILLSENIVKYV
jgi:hypothetical protein